MRRALLKHHPRHLAVLYLAANKAGWGKALAAEMAQALDYAVLVCDPREEYRAGWNEAGNVAGATLLDGMPDDAVQAARPDARTAIVALTHDPKLDDMALMEVLRTDAFYIGALGSRRNQARRRERLSLLDLSPEQIAKLRGPVGVPIGSRTSAEIAVAILADLIAVRNGIALIELLRKEQVKIIACADAARGMGASLACGVRATPDATGWLIALGGMPDVPPHVVAALVEHLRDIDTPNDLAGAASPG